MSEDSYTHLKAEQYKTISVNPTTYHTQVQILLTYNILPKTTT